MIWDEILFFLFIHQKVSIVVWHTAKAHFGQSHRRFISLLNDNTIADAQIGTDAVCLYDFVIDEKGLGIFAVFIANANNNNGYTCVVLGIITPFEGRISKRNFLITA